jgi:integrase
LLVFVVLKAALRQAVEDRDLLRNPMDGIKRPKPPKKDVVVLDEEQMAALLAAAKKARGAMPLYVPLLVLATTGLRRNECLALRWQDVDLERGLLTVNQALEQVIGEGVKAKAPKNDSSRRTIKIPSVTVEAIRQHREGQFARRQLMGEDYRDLGLIFERGDGTPIRPTAFSGAFARLARRQGLLGIHVHSLRHSHVAQLISQRAPMKAISDRAGHANIQTTMNLYGHLLPAVEAEVVEHFDAAFRAAMEKTGSNG